MGITNTHWNRILYPTSEAQTHISRSHRANQGGRLNGRRYGTRFNLYTTNELDHTKRLAPLPWYPHISYREMRYNSQTRIYLALPRFFEDVPHPSIEIKMGSLFFIVDDSPTRNVDCTLIIHLFSKGANSPASYSLLINIHAPIRKLALLRVTCPFT